ncbi:MAG TPA: 2Fe-2S iron-sulfur cluster-binding protein [Burkholderiales bacterium]|nr:2Fe-2S iron-sulfur cluster-binding protein [Burkholderiales bacterium]
MTAFRLAEGGRIDRARPLEFSFDGRKFQGFQGDTLASALLANDVFLVGRSFKYHRPRGVMSAGIEETNALVAVGEGGRLDTNSRATMVELYGGLVARSLNRWPSLGLDLGAINGWFSPLLVAGFYYKTFMWPRRLWQSLYEPLIRRVAGIGEAPAQPDPDRYDKMHRHCDVLVVGGGRAGRAAASEAAAAGKRVVLCDEGDPGAIAKVEVLARTTVFGYYDDNFLCAVESDARRQKRLWHFRAKEVVLATGAHERPLVFGGNDKPGVMLAGAVETYLRRYAVAPGKRAVVFTNNDSGHERARAFRELGIDVAAVIDSREGTVITRTLGGKRVTGVEVGGSRIACDLVAMAGGFSPVVHLYSQAQGKLRWDEKKLCFVPDGCRQAVRVVGRANGEFPEYRIAPLWEVEEDKAFVDFGSDVVARDVHLAAREGFSSVEHFKRYTTTGMAADQGKTSNINALAILAGATGRNIAETGTTTFRAPYAPVSYGVLAGRDLGDFLEPIRVTPMHDWHAAHGAAFENVGQWKRPWYYGRDMHDAVQAEARSVRKSLGVLDASTLGKIDIQGRDAARFLDRIYAGTFSTLAIGRARYGLMCREDGMVFDDGVTARLGENHFHMTTTTGGAARVLDWLEEYLQTEWPELEVYCTSVTEQWATVAVAGPRAGELMKELGFQTELPFMAFKEATIAGIGARVFRISFTGELSYEINVPGDQGLALWKAVMIAGEKHGITPYGTETMHLLRAEKGFIIVGQETDGTVTPYDLGLDWAVAKSKDFIGRRSLTRPDTRREDRKQLVGLLPADPREVLPEGAQITEVDVALPRGHGSKPVPMVGHVTSSYLSPNLGRSFALALVRSGRSRRGAELFVPLQGRAAKVRVVEPVFIK